MSNDNVAASIDRTTAQRIASFIERAEFILAEIGDKQEDLKQLWHEAKGVGFDVAALKTIVRLRRKDPKKIQEAQSIEELYVHALGALIDTPLGDWARQHMNDEAAVRTKAVVGTAQVTSKAYVEAYAKAHGLEHEAAE